MNFIGKETINGKQHFFIKNPTECTDFKHILGKEIDIDGMTYLAVGVERLAHAPPWRKGEVISIMVDPGFNG